MKQSDGAKKVTIMAAATAVSLFGDSILYLVLPLFWREMGLTAIWQIGVLLSVNRFIRLPLNPYIAWIYKHISFRTGFTAAMILAAFTTFAYGALQGFWLLLLARILWGVAWSLLKLGAYLAIPDLADPGKRSYLFGLHKGITRTGALAGMLIGALFVEQTGVYAVTTVFALLSLATIPFLFLLGGGSLAREQGRTAALTSYGSILKTPFLNTLLLSAVLTAVIFDGVLKSTLTYLLEDQMRTAWVIVGLVIGAAALGSILQGVRILWEGVFSAWAGARMDGPVNRLQLMAVHFVTVGLLLLLLPFPVPIALFIGVVLLLQLAATSLEIILLSLAADAAEKTSRVKMMTSFSIAQDLGAALGPLVGYAAAQFIGIHMLFIILAAVAGLQGLRWMFPPKNSSAYNNKYRQSAS